jgi:DNA replication protein DnaC
MSDLTARLSKLGMRVSEEALRAFLTHAQKSKLSPAQIVEQLCAVEQQERDARNLARRTKAATLARPAPLDTFDWNHPRKIDRHLYDELLTLEFLRRSENILFRGQAGIGKSSLAQNLGVAALAKGYNVRFATVSAALVDLIRQESIPATERRLKRYVNPDLLILDELGYVPCDSRAADMLFHIVSRRHEKRSIIITTNLAYKQWPSVFGEASCIGAMVDRFAQHCHTFDIDADSWRERHSLKRKEPARIKSK